MIILFPVQFYKNIINSACAKILVWVHDDFSNEI